MKPPIKIQLENIVKTPTPIPLTDNPRTKQPQKIPLKSIIYDAYDVKAEEQLYTKNENNKQNNTTSIQELESYETD
jgi:hypothetical protein